MQRKKIILRSIAVFIVLAVITGISIFQYRKKQQYRIDPISKETMDYISSGSFDKLMIVAHPDDETLWGGAHLSEHGYLVVCITNGNNEVRSKEFKKAVDYLGNEGIILSYPDLTNGKKDDWDHVYNQIKKDMEKVISAKDWSVIATHNPSGEYGHIHHKMTDEIVTNLCIKHEITDKLYYFGKYYSKKKIDQASKNLKKISDEQLQKKEEALKFYESQKKAKSMFCHMNPYEEWQKYTDM